MPNDEPVPILFTYWGRRGLTRFAQMVAQEAFANPSLSPTISVSRQNEEFSTFEALCPSLLPVRTFGTNMGVLTQCWRIPMIRRQLMTHIGRYRTKAVIELMTHAWSPFIAPAIRSAGARYVVIVHDALPHPGDYRTSAIHFVLLRTLGQADKILTLSRSVADQLKAGGTIDPNKISTLFHPDLQFGASRPPASPGPGEPIRLLFFGRIMAYKGLPLFVDMVELLRQQGVAVDVGVFGEGELGDCAPRLQALGARVVNHWLTSEELAGALSHYHAVVLSHVEASQSGVAATAFGAGVPVIATPVGGLTEQVRTGINGILADRVDASALAAAVRRLFSDPGLYAAVCENIARLKPEQSVHRFVQVCVREALSATPTSSNVIS